MRNVQGWRVQWKSSTEHPDLQTFNLEYPSWLSSVVFWPKNHPWNQSQVEIVLGGTVPSDEADCSSLGEIKPVYYSREEKLLSLDVLKLYRGEDMICQNPEDIEPNWWLDKGELTELPDTPMGEAEIMTRETTGDGRDPEIPLEPDLEI